MVRMVYPLFVNVDLGEGILGVVFKRVWLMMAILHNQVKLVAELQKGRDKMELYHSSNCVIQ